MSTKGQIVIPEKLRREFEVGSQFVVSKFGDMLVLKPVKGFTNRELKEIDELKRTWDEIDEGKSDSYAEDEFFEAMRQW